MPQALVLDRRWVKVGGGGNPKRGGGAVAGDLKSSFSPRLKREAGRGAKFTGKWHRLGAGERSDQK